MRKKLYDVYNEALLGQPSSEETLHASHVPGRAHDYVAAGPNGQPVILLSYSSPNGLIRPPISLQHVTVEFGVPFRVRTTSTIEDGNFVVISFCSKDTALAEPFCIAAEILIAALPELPTVLQIEKVVREFVELMTSLSLPSSRAVSGLWAELWLISVSTDPQESIAAWHETPTECYDFEFQKHIIEVKATEQKERNHEFSYMQLGSSTLPVAVASLKLRRSSNGTSLFDLVEKIQIRISSEMRIKLVRNIFNAIGLAVSEAEEIRFDESFAAANLRVIHANNLPKVIIPKGSPISAVRFQINLDHSSLVAALKKPTASVALQLVAD
jgi:hypothetical protein